ncbi:MAG: allose kinase [Christensenellaceae bacterium]
MKDYIVGIDIGGTNFRIGAVTLNGEVSDVKIIPSKFLSESGDAVANLTEYIKNYINHSNLEHIMAVSIGFPGSISKDMKSTYSVPNMLNAKGEHVFDNKNIVKSMQKELGIPIYINKDVNNLLEYDMILNDLHSQSIVVGCYIGTGFGGSIYLNGEFMLGKNGVASEIGHIPFYKSQLVCACGKKACAECYTSGRALKLMQEEFYPDTFIGDMFLKHSEDQRLIDFVEASAIPIATEINIFDPDVVVIGGGVAHMKGFPINLLIDFVMENTRKPYPYNNIKIVLSKYCDDMGVLGAVVFAMDKLKIGFKEMMVSNIKEYANSKQ